MNVSTVARKKNLMEKTVTLNLTSIRYIKYSRLKMKNKLHKLKNNYE